VRTNTCNERPCKSNDDLDLHLTDLAWRQTALEAWGLSICRFLLTLFRTARCVVAHRRCGITARVSSLALDHRVSCRATAEKSLSAVPVRWTIGNTAAAWHYLSACLVVTPLHSGRLVATASGNTVLVPPDQRQQPCARSRISALRIWQGHW
jgi:hypothetical protein